ncbi:MAG: hypothetical protein Q6364_09365 [Candidatus Hermodarchaeota archaeon]|nr:hypothetical protein [Candidatus Hermodarchaeota archaeon]
MKVKVAVRGSRVLFSVLIHFIFENGMMLSENVFLEGVFVEFVEALVHVGIDLVPIFPREVTDRLELVAFEPVRG